jgi:hypothetical protein
MPATNPITYDVGDTTNLSMSMAGTNVDVGLMSALAIELAFTQEAGTLLTRASILSLSGQMTNSMGAGTSIGDAQKPGPANLEVSPRGVVAVRGEFEMAAELRQLMGGLHPAMELFLRLPGRAVPVGTEWTDTVVNDNNAPSMSGRTQRIITSHLASDTRVAGRRLQVIQSQIVLSAQISGSNQGYDFRQSLSGTSSATSLWDPARGVLVERNESGTQSGTMEMPAMGMTGIPVSMSNRRVIRLRS